VNKTKPLARLQNAADYDRLVEGLIRIITVLALRY